MDIKICGVCTPADAALVRDAGADCIGVILAPGHGRSRDVTQATSIFTAAGDLRRAGVFVDQNVGDVLAAARELALDIAQLHGAEPVASARELRHAGLEVWKAVRIRSRDDVARALETYADEVDALLLDGWSARAAGGTGTRFEWSDVASLRDSWPATLRLVAAGGLDAENVADAVAALRPDVVDVSSGVEAALCRKSPERVRAFIAAARAAEQGRAQG